MHKSLFMWPRRAVAAALLSCLPWVGAMAQDYPARPITIIVPQPPGSASDNVTRPIAIALKEALGQPVIVENKGGAAGMIGMGQAARAAPDGYTLVVVSNTTMAANPSMYRKLPYDAEKDYAPVALMGMTSMMFVVRSEFPAESLDALLAQAGQRGTPFTAGYGSSTAQVALNMLTTVSNTAMTPVPYPGTPKLLVDLIGGTVDLAVVDIGNGMVQARAGKVRPLAIAASRRLEAAGDVPTLAERFQNATMDTWIALAAPAGTPPAVVDRLNAAVNQAARRPDVRQAFSTVAIDIATATPAELGAMIRADQKKWPAMIRAAGIEPQ